MTSKGNKKTFVLDTNVMLHDYHSIYNFQDNDIVIPIVVLEELDKFKRGNDQIHFHAREFARSLDSISDPDFFDKGAALGEGRGRLFIRPGVPFSEKIRQSFREDIPDHRILAVTECLANEKPGEKVILVTKDINLRMKARSLGLLAEDYKSDQVEDPDETLYSTIRTLFDVPDEVIARIHGQGSVPVAEVFPDRGVVRGNPFYVIEEDEDASTLAAGDPTRHVIRAVKKREAFGIFPKNDEQAFALDALLNPAIPLVAVSGKAGTGKTLLALAAALQQHAAFEQIFLARPVVALSNKDLGFLPGDVKEKVSPYMQPLFDNLGVIRHRYNASGKENRLIDEMLKDQRLLISALAYIRGRSLSNIFFIVDEAQNLSPHEVKTIITRAGEGCKMVFTGDIDQIDSPYLDRRSNGLSYLFTRLEGHDLFAHVHLEKGERSRLSEMASDLL
ncbi:MAG: PhoH family protein [Odoribacteraceae bacterium]|jgi:PhoH-like ATPase|nr:PhoH family protein [Odoribacteraceae bacterium]